MSLFGGKKRDEDGGATDLPFAPASGDAATRAASEDQRNTSNARAGGAQGGGGKTVANIGKSIIFKGELSGDEDLVLEGQVEGRIQLLSHQLTIGANARVKAEIEAKQVVVVGHVVGNIVATERVEIQATGVVEGDLQAPKLLVQEGAVVDGTIDMTAAAKPTKKPEAPSTPEPARKTG